MATIDIPFKRFNILHIKARNSITHQKQSNFEGKSRCEQFSNLYSFFNSNEKKGYNFRFAKEFIYLKSLRL